MNQSKSMGRSPLLRNTAGRPPLSEKLKEQAADEGCFEKQLAQEFKDDLEKVAASLFEIACYPALHPITNAHACAELKWLATNPSLVTRFFANSDWTVVDGVLDPSLQRRKDAGEVLLGLRGRSDGLTPPPQIAPQTLRYNNLVYGIVIDRLLRNTSNSADVCAAMARVPGNTLKVFQDVQIRFWEILYSKRPNPFVVWSGYSAAREAGRPVPEWVLKVLDPAADEIAKIVSERQDGPMRLPDRVGKALGFGITLKAGIKASGRNDHLTDARNLARNLGLYAYAEPKLNKKGIPDDVKAEAGRRFPTPKDEIAKIFKDIDDWVNDRPNLSR